MLLYQNSTRSILDLYLSNLRLEPDAEYELQLDVLGGGINLYLHGMFPGGGSHYIEESPVWKHCGIPFSTHGCSAEQLAENADWAISFVKKIGERISTASADTYIDNVCLVNTARPQTPLILGGDFERPRSDRIYDRHWRNRFFGMHGVRLGVDIATDPLDAGNHCLRLPKTLNAAICPEHLPLQVEQYGYLKGNETDVKTVNATDAPNHLLLLVKHGHLAVTTPTQCATADSGELLYFPAADRLSFSLDGGKNTAYYWLRVGGAYAAALLGACGLRGQARRPLADVAALTVYIDRMSRYEDTALTYLYAITGQLQLFFAELENQLLALPPIREADLLIREAAFRIAQSPETVPNNEQLAKQCHLSKNHFISRFKKQIGYTPQQYRLNELMNKAAVLLRDTELPVQEVAYSLGISDPFYFSRLFRQIHGVSPRDYRKHS